MDERIRKLVAVGASVGANCHPCLEYHVAEALAFGIDREELAEVVNTAKGVRAGAASSMDKLALKLVRDSMPVVGGEQKQSCCC